MTMIAKFIERFDKARGDLLREFSEKHPAGYRGIVEAVIRVISDEDEDDYTPDPGRVHSIDDGHYQGTLVYVIACKGYQPRVYWYVTISYGSCSGCDTFEAIRSENYDDKPSEKQAKEYLQLALNVLQRLKRMDPDEE